MKNKVIFIFLIFTSFFNFCISQTKKDIQRVEELSTIQRLYDSIIKNGGWISLTQFKNKPTQISLKQKDSVVIETGADSITDPKLKTLILLNRNDLDAINRLFALMYAFNHDYFSVACSGDPKTETYTIVLFYKWNRSSTRRYFYQYINGDKELKLAYNNKNLKHISGNVFKGSGIQK